MTKFLYVAATLGLVVLWAVPLYCVPTLIKSDLIFDETSLQDGVPETDSLRPKRKIQDGEDLGVFINKVRKIKQRLQKEEMRNMDFDESNEGDQIQTGGKGFAQNKIQDQQMKLKNRGENPPVNLDQDDSACVDDTEQPEVKPSLNKKAKTALKAKASPEKRKANDWTFRDLKSGSRKRNVDNSDTDKINTLPETVGIHVEDDDEACVDDLEPMFKRSVDKKETQKLGNKNKKTVKREIEAERTPNYLKSMSRSKQQILNETADPNVAQKPSSVDKLNKISNEKESDVDEEACTDDEEAIKEKKPTLLKDKTKIKNKRETKEKPLPDAMKMEETEQQPQIQKKKC